MHPSHKGGYGQARQNQRFSWQPPLETPPEEDAPSYEVSQQQQQQQRQSVHINTNVNRNDRAFSYAQTPIEHRAPNYTTAASEPLPGPSSPIAFQPQSPYSANSAIPQPQSPTYGRTPFTPLAPNPSAQPAAFSPVSPIAALPRIQTQGTNHARQRSNLSPLNTNVGQYAAPPVPPMPAHTADAGPLPSKTPITPISSGPLKKDIPLSPIHSRASYPAEPYSPHGFTTNPGREVFSPDAAHGPNGLDFALHQPGQIAHPNMESENSREWKHSLCECTGDIGTCLTGLFCPCILYGRTAYRLSQRSNKQDPTNLLDHSNTNGHCMLMGVSCGLWWLYPMIQRTRIRHLYKLGGSFTSDLLKGCCCCCCVAVQNEREVRDREESSRRWAGPASTEVYTRPEMMTYPSRG
ncbi:PLAC8-domain-containing protein [Amniculicola lignicola CBS 123094]|uniref:PLAC8-domain-containing protein n=1 Tax=Amniculicola lignicola CBS 123094 TaxID=1392246 RepID=A0A6A5WGB9_9PLEO|nr:PLAC8-domain-containing protein [Amniculicola lignicola CBS 123094]